jgi:hypothetical protein
LSATGVDLDLEARPLRGLDPGHHLLVAAPAGDSPEALRVERVERDVHPAHAGRGQRLGVALELAAVGGHRQLVEGARAQVPAERAHQPHHVAPDQRLAAGEPDLAHA